ncbi:MAG: pyridoxal phosphate-dependent aminotransferase [Clostridiales bacterium]|nr:pyridoxal phosphate-dependent aminotransferase [Clostridiales bacterium]
MRLQISNRCRSISPSPTLVIDSKAKAMKKKGIDVVGFGAGEPDFDTPEYIRNAAKAALDAGMTRYTPSSGTLELRTAICEKLKRDNGLEYEPDQIVVSNGAKHSLFNICQTILDPGDEVIIPEPFWVSYPELVQIAGGVPVMVHGHEENDFLVSADDMKPYITPRIKAIILNSPNNPNGCVWPREMLEGIARLAVENQLFVISDEIYEKLVYDGEKHVSIASLGEEIKAQTFVVNGFSKAYAMTGWRLGYCAGPTNVMKAVGALQSHATSNPNSIAQYAGYVALSGGDDIIAAMVAEFDRRRKHIVSRINAIPGLSCRMPKGAFYVMMNISELIGAAQGDKVIRSSTDFAELLLENAKVAVVPGLGFGSDMHVRLSYATSMENIDRGLDRIAQFVGSLRKA